MASFNCDGCSEVIPPQKARFNCQSCPNYDSCANCQILGQVTGNHAPDHYVALFRYSGGSGPPDFPPRIRNPNYSTTGWTPLYNPDHSPSEIFITVLLEFLDCLDPRMTGYVTPEAYSAFQEAQGCPQRHNIWRNVYELLFGNTSAADASLKQAYELCSLEHILVPRDQAQPQGSALRSNPSPMPLLTVRGFVHGVAEEVIANPTLWWTYLNRAMRLFQLPTWMRLGDIPREMIPLTAPLSVQDRVRKIQGNATAMANNQLEMARAAAETQMREDKIPLLAIANVAISDAGNGDTAMDYTVNIDAATGDAVNGDAAMGISDVAMGYTVLGDAATGDAVNGDVAMGYMVIGDAGPGSAVISNTAMVYAAMGDGAIDDGQWVYLP